MSRQITILAVDDEKLMLERLCRCISEAKPDADVISFKSPTEALKYVQDNKIDVAFLDISMRKMTGMDLARQIKFLRPNANIIFVTGYSDYIFEAISEIRCSGYILKPVTTEQIVEELENLRNPVKLEKSDKLKVQCFGNFEVYVDGHTLKFKSAKAKELFAYLVDRNGTMCTNGEITATLWEDDGNHYSYLKKTKRDLMETLKSVGCQDIISIQRGQMGIYKDKIDCDYYGWIEGTPTGINAYHGEYMAQYSWGEVTNSSLRVSD